MHLVHKDTEPPPPGEWAESTVKEDKAPSFTGPFQMGQSRDFQERAQWSKKALVVPWSGQSCHQDRQVASRAEATSCLGEFQKGHPRGGPSSPGSSFPPSLSRLMLSVRRVTGWEAGARGSLWPNELQN